MWLQGESLQLRWLSEAITSLLTFIPRDHRVGGFDNVHMAKIEDWLTTRSGDWGTGDGEELLVTHQSYEEDSPCALQFFWSALLAWEF